MEPRAVGEDLARRLALGERVTDVLRLPGDNDDNSDAPSHLHTSQETTTDELLPSEEAEPVQQEEPEEAVATDPPHHEHTHRPRHRHFEEHVLLVEPDENTGVGITIHTPTQIVHSRHIYQKTRYYSCDAYVLAVLAFVVRWIVFLCFLFVGSANGAAFSMLLCLTEIAAAFVVVTRTWRGAMRLQLAIGNWCLMAAVAETGVAVSGCITNWMALSKPWARWSAVAFSFIHAMLIWQLGSAVINVLHGKMSTSFQAGKLMRATRLAHGDPPPPGSVENAKRTQ